jgi:hypothetical protein
MNSKSRTKRVAAFAAAFMLALLPASNILAQSDDFGVWTSIDAKKKLTDKLQFGIEGELRTIDGVAEIDRRSLGLSMSYKFTKWLKADIGYIYIQSHNEQEKNIKGYAGDDAMGTPVFNYNLDHSYWEERDRFYIGATLDWKVGRVKFSLRERLQYQYTHSALVYEDKYVYTPVDRDDPLSYVVLDDDASKSEAELKDSKHSTLIRSRLTAKWDIKNCKVEPFVSVELFTRTDEWCGHDKLRYRIGAEYKIDKKNDISLYYMYQDNHTSSSPAGHAIGVGYSFEL